MNTIQDKHIVMLNKSYPPKMGGIERHVRDISETLSQRGWKVTALVCADHQEASDEFIHGVRVIRIPRWGTVLSQPLTWNFANTLLSLKADIVHCHVPFPLAWLAVQNLPTHIPVICTWHSDIVRQRFLMPLLSGWEQAFLKRCQTVIATSPEYLQSSIPLRHHHEKCRVIPLTLPDETHTNDTLIESVIEAYSQRFRSKRILYVGRLVGYKGVKYLIQAMQNVDADLILAGDGPLEHALKQLANQLHLKDKIHFLGFIDESEKQALYRMADVFVLPSIQRSEAFGYVLLEAMSQGTPVITTDMPTGVRWVNQHEETGLVVPPKNSAALADAVNQIIHQPTVRERYSKNALARIKCGFQFNEWLSKLEQLYTASLT